MRRCKQNIINEGKKRQLQNIITKEQRGVIFDRNKNILAMSLPSKTLCINPSKLHQIENKDDLKKISKIINIPYEKIHKAIYRNKDKKEYYLKRHISKLEFTEIEKYTNSYIYFINESKRSYLGGEAFSNILGFTSIDDEGQEGIELAKDGVLKPSDGIKKIKKDNIGREVETIEIIKKPKAGLNVTLSLDKQIQIIGYDVLKKYVKKFNAESGSIVLVETKTGKILSMTNYPSFDPEKEQVIQVKKSEIE